MSAGITEHQTTTLRCSQNVSSHVWLQVSILHRLLLSGQCRMLSDYGHLGNGIGIESDGKSDPGDALNIADISASGVQ